MNMTEIMNKLFEYIAHKTYVLLLIHIPLKMHDTTNKV